MFQVLKLPQTLPEFLETLELVWKLIKFSTCQQETCSWRNSFKIFLVTNVWEKLLIKWLHKSFIDVESQFFSQNTFRRFSILNILSTWLKALYINYWCMKCQHLMCWEINVRIMHFSFRLSIGNGGENQSFDNFCCMLCCHRCWNG